MCSVENDAVPAKLDETQSHIRPVLVQKNDHWAW